ncbi:hypothetical protein F5879DRAFT_976588 [Lentinula edodes]|nr:hypothetical protein F5879DRAFT_976588 [Lentinula edodes]
MNLTLTLAMLFLKASRACPPIRSSCILLLFLLLQAKVSPPPKQKPALADHVTNDSKPRRPPASITTFLRRLWTCSLT